MRFARPKGANTMKKILSFLSLVRPSTFIFFFLFCFLISDLRTLPSAFRPLPSAFAAPLLSDSGIPETFPQTTAVDLTVVEEGKYHATAQTIFKVDLSEYKGKELTFSTEVTGVTIWFVDAVSIGKIGGASGVSCYNNTDSDFILGLDFITSTSGFKTACDGLLSCEAIP